MGCKVFLCLPLVVLMLAGELLAQSSSSGSATSQSSKTPAKGGVTEKLTGVTSSKPRSSGLTPEREAAAMTFVRQHHAELVELLRYLKEQQPTAYEQAVMDLFRASERLAQQQEQNLERYEIDLELWKTESRIELLAARLKMAGRDSPEGESLAPQLKSLLEQRHDLRQERLLFERRKLAERAERLDRQLAAMKENREQSINRELQRFVGSDASGANEAPFKKKLQAKPLQ